MIFRHKVSAGRLEVCYAKGLLRYREGVKADDGNRTRDLLITSELLCL